MIENDFLPLFFVCFLWVNEVKNDFFRALSLSGTENEKKSTKNFNLEIDHFHTTTMSHNEVTNFNFITFMSNPRQYEISYTAIVFIGGHRLSVRSICSQLVEFVS